MQAQPRPLPIARVCFGILAFLLTGAIAEAQFSGFVKPLDWPTYDGLASDDRYSTPYLGDHRNNPEGSGSHVGVDIRGDKAGRRLTTSSTVRAIYEGTVERVMHVPADSGWGNAIVIRHTGIPDAGPTSTVLSTYAHLSSFAGAFIKGDHVDKDALLGYVGFSGLKSSAAIHLHFQLDLDYSSQLPCGRPTPPSPLHPFYPNRTSGDEENIPDSDGCVKSHTLHPIRFVEAHLVPPKVLKAIDDIYSMTQGGTLEAPSQGIPSLLDNDTYDPNTFQSLTFLNVPQGFQPVGTTGFRLTPPAGFVGQIQFQYSIHTTTVDSLQATVTIQVNPRPIPPVAIDHTYTMTQGTTFVVPTSVLSGGTSPTGSTVDFFFPATPVGLSGRTDGTFTADMTQSPNFTGPIIFQYDIRSPGGLVSNVATVTVNVTPRQTGVTITDAGQVSGLTFHFPAPYPNDMFACMFFTGVDGSGSAVTHRLVGTSSVSLAIPTGTLDFNPPMEQYVSSSMTNGTYTVGSYLAANDCLGDQNAVEKTSFVRTAATPAFGAVGHWSIGSVQVTPAAACIPAFVDDFNGADGAVGNGWIDMTSNANGNLLIKNGVLSTPGPIGYGGIYRPIDLSKPTTVSATFTYLNGFGGALYRYDTTFLFGNNGSGDSGYGLAFNRGDQNYSDSRVSLVSDGVLLAQLPSSFQFATSLTATFTLGLDGSITGSVTGDGNTFPFSFGPRGVTLPGSNLAVQMGFPDSRSTVITNATLDNLSISYSCPTPIVLDQSTAGNCSNCYAGAALEFDQGLAQTFRVGVTGLLSQVELGLYRLAGTTTDLVLDIMPASSLPAMICTQIPCSDTDLDGASLFRAHIPVVAVPVCVPGSLTNPCSTPLVTVDVRSAGILVLAGQELAIVLRRPGGTSSPLWVIWQAGGNYNRGVPWVSDPIVPSNGWWVEPSAQSRIFRTWVEP